MQFDELIGNTLIAKQLKASIDKSRVAHAHLFIGEEGSGTLGMALAFATELVSSKHLDPQLRDSCLIKCSHFNHPDIHFAYPVVPTTEFKKPVSDHFTEQWRNFLIDQPYGNLFDWYQVLGVENKQGRIGVNEASEIVKKTSLKSYEGGYKVLIIWRADTMNTETANKLLKLLEEPPEDTVFILVADSVENILPTIRSRCQISFFKRISESEIEVALIDKGVSFDKAKELAHRAHGDLNKAFDLIHNTSEDQVFARWFVHWVRTAFKAKGNKAAVHDLLMWATEVSKTGRETQKNFLNYALRMMRQALMANYGIDKLCFMKVDVDGFDFEKFAVYVHENNIEFIVEALEKAMYHIERNGNSKIILTDMALELTRYIHKKPTGIK